ncbi:AAA family ATPase [Methylobacterium haplocladii]|nr:AAA family ATPase [Methylobacterium haplocladii]
MKITCIEVINFRKLKSTHIDIDGSTTIFVGANNSGKTSAMVALRYFLLAPNKLSLRDITIANWVGIDAVGSAWEAEEDATSSLADQLPSMDVWLDVPVQEIQHVVHLIPTLGWRGGALGVRLAYTLIDQDKLKADYLREHAAAGLIVKAQSGTSDAIKVWPSCLTEFLERRLNAYVSLQTYTLDPAARVAPVKGLATPQPLPPTAVALGANPFKGLIKIDEIAAQRDFADAGERVDRSTERAGEHQQNSRRFKRRLSDQLRSYYDRHIDPTRTPSPEDYDALGAIQSAEKNFDKRLKHGFSAAFKELEDLGYPGIANPKLKISTMLKATDGLKHGSAVQYQVGDPSGDGTKTLQLPEDYSGLGYQNLIAMIFMLMSYRDEWMRVGKASLEGDLTREEKIEPLHLVIVEEPEAHLHAQVQQVFIKKAYGLLRKHSDLGANTTFSTQLVVSTHSSHVAHEADFSSLRYFRRRPAVSLAETATTTVANLSYVFGEGDATQRFVKRYLKATHCDLFFADGIIFVEGQAERILIPHFIRHHFESLARRYVTILDIGGAHTHKFKALVDELGLATLIIADLDACALSQTPGKPSRWKSAKPTIGAKQRTTNPVLKDWHPQMEEIDSLCSLNSDEHSLPNADGYELYVAYQKPTTVTLPGKGSDTVIPRTFEDALIFENHEVTKKITGSAVAEKIKNVVAAAETGENLADELHELLKSAEKAAFAIDCLMINDAKAIKPPAYVADGLKWFEAAIGRDLIESDPVAAAA